jgi:hypothetical protein
MQLINTVYYQLKPLIPRLFQLWLRSRIVLRKRSAYANIWPILDKAATPPDDWAGWPEQKKFALVLTHDVETAKGQKKCRQLIKLEQSLGFRSSFNFVPERYSVSPDLRLYLTSIGFEVGVHGLKHDGKLYASKKIFQQRASKINEYLKEWKAVGFRSPAMHHNLDWFHDLIIEYDASTFDTDPFEPLPSGLGTIFPLWIKSNSNQSGYIELPYTLPQDFTLYILLKEKNIDIWKRKLDWIAEKGGMALINVHPDYINFDGDDLALEEYPVQYYEQFLQYLKAKYEGAYWHVLPKDMARFWSATARLKHYLHSG